MPILPLQLSAGLNLTDSPEPNQLKDAQDVSFDENGILSTRHGTALFGNPVPDTVILLNAGDDNTEWAETGDADNLSDESSTNKRGSAAVEFDVDVSHAPGSDNAIMTNASVGNVDISSANGYAGFWLFVPDGANTNLTSFEVRVGTDSSNYYKQTFTLTENKYQFIKLIYADATEVGTVDESDIDYIQIIITYSAAYTDKAGWQICDFRSYSSSSSSPITSYHEHERDDGVTAINLVKIVTLCVAGTNMFQYDEDSSNWTWIHGSLTEFETAVGRTTERTRWAFTTHRNVTYMCNGINDYMWFDGIVTDTNGATPKVRTLLQMIDRVFGGGEDDNPLTLHYTNAAAANAQTLPNAVVVGGDEQGVRINSLKRKTTSAGGIVLAGTFNQIFAVDVVGATSLPINNQNGMYSDRVTTEVGNSILYESDSGLETLRFKRGTAGGAEALESEAVTNDIQELMREIHSSQLNANVALYAKPLKNYYLSYDSNIDNIPDRTLVLSTLVKGRVWTKYNWTSAYDLGQHKDSNGNIKYVLASAVGGQFFEVETGFTDDGVEIIFRIETSNIDPVNPDPDKKLKTHLKNFEWIDFVGKMNEGGIINMEIYIGDKLRRVKTITDENLDTDATATPVGTNPIGAEAIGGGGEEGDDIDVFPYKKRVSLVNLMGATIRVVLFGDVNLMHAKFEQIVVKADGEVFDLIPRAQRR